MSTLLVTGPTQLVGRVRPPPDKSIAHRAMILSALGRGRARIEPLPTGEDNRATARALASLGVPIDLDEHRGFAEIEGIGDPENLHPAVGPIDCKNSGTTMRLLAGVLAAAPFTTTMVGDASLMRRPMSRLKPLERMGARVTGTIDGDEMRPPITIRGGPLVGADHHLEIASAQVKSTLLLAGLFARGRTVVAEPAQSRDHTERMLTGLGVRLETATDGGIIVQPREAAWTNVTHHVPPDFSSAAFVLGAAIVTSSPDVVVETGINPTRTGFLDAAAAMGCPIETIPIPSPDREPRGLLRVADRGRRTGTVIDGLTTLRAIDEIPLLAGLAASAGGETVIRDAAELRHKESDRLASTAAMLRAFGADVEESADGLAIAGDAALHAAEVDAAHDHRIALTAAVVALGVEGTTAITGAEAIDVSFPGFANMLRGLGARVDVRR